MTAHRDSRSFRQSLHRNDSKVTDKQINYLIHLMEPLHNRNEDYHKYLSLWNQYSFSRKIQKKQADQILLKKIKKSYNSQGSNICQICYEQMSRKRNWCRICGNQCCEKCIARFRVMNEQVEPVLFCAKCDKEYLVAMIVKQQQAKFEIREKAFLKLAEQQQMIQSLLNIQRSKLTNCDGQNKNLLLKFMNMITQYNSANQILKHQISELKKKIEWGEEVRVHLKKKLIKFKKDHSHSFTSSQVNGDQQWAPPKVDNGQEVQVDNLNESLINSMLENESQQEQPEHRKCNCSLF